MFSFNPFRAGSLTLVAGLVLSLANIASADSCGHYVKRLGPGFVPGKAAAEKVAANSHNMRTSAPCPCEGPQCRRAPQDQTPLPPSAPVSSILPQELMSLADRNVDFNFGSSWLAGEFSGRPSRGYPLGTNRPPSA
ncbi:MAG: hypothetical protein L0211_03360 [Planctomycetaceae bacterium]|nr:hypothetical protein [Planctomycetaceae bacterium]